MKINEIQHVRRDLPLLTNIVSTGISGRYRSPAKILYLRTTANVAETEGYNPYDKPADPPAHADTNDKVAQLRKSLDRSGRQ
jgi:hypothetical protein